MSLTHQSCPTTKKDAFELSKPYYTDAFLSKPEQLTSTKQRNCCFLTSNLKMMVLVKLIFHPFFNSCVTKLVPVTFQNKFPTESFYLNKPIRAKLLNYKQTLEEFAESQCLPSCKCSTSSFIYGPAGHVITGNLDFIANPTVRTIFEKGPNHRIPQKINYTIISDDFKSQLNNLITKWCREKKFLK